MNPWVKLVLSAVMLSVPFLAEPKEAAALCAQDTHCTFYTDDTYTEICGERNSCIDCTTSNDQWGCTGSPDRWCETYGQCGSSHSCVQCFSWGCVSGSCP